MSANTKSNGVAGGGEPGRPVVAAVGGVSGLSQVSDDQIGQAGLVVDDQAVHGGQTSRPPATAGWLAGWLAGWREGFMVCSRRFSKAWQVPARTRRTVGA
ncbi:hypothetical protein ACFY1B_45270 [Streptomyces mirabilis]|uniref:hypothetical protein n=1 Tax=Streptomyces mirabilis TaxID=68239 RepID=UPI0036A66F1A